MQGSCWDESFVISIRHACRSPAVHPLPPNIVQHLHPPAQQNNHLSDRILSSLAVWSPAATDDDGALPELQGKTTLFLLCTYLC